MSANSSQPVDADVELLQQLWLSVEPSTLPGPAAHACARVWRQAFGLSEVAIRWTGPAQLAGDCAGWGPNGPLATRAADRLIEAGNQSGHWRESHFRDGVPLTISCSSSPPAGSLLTAFQTATAEILSRSIRFDRLLREEKLKSLAEFAAGAGHEINNPLGSIVGRAGQLLREESDPERRRLLEFIGAQAYRIRDMIGDCMLFARPPAPKFQSLILSQLIEQAAAPLHDELRQHRVSLSLPPSDARRVRADAVQVSVVIAELLRNSLSAVSPGGWIRVTIDDEPGGSDLGDLQQPVVAGSLRVTVSDSGPGFSPEERRHAFDPFYSGRPAGRGLGFGLSKCWRILQLHGGGIDLGPSATPTSVSFWLPFEPDC